MDWEAYKRRRMNNEERAAVMHLDMLSRSFEYCLGKLAGRLAGYRYLKRDAAMVKSVCGRLRDAALGENPGELEQQIVRQSRDYRLGLERVSPIRRAEEVVMPLEDEWQLIHICLESRCGLCMMTAGESATCKIRALLRRYCDEPEPGMLRGCGYQGCDLSDGSRTRMNKQERL